MQNSSSESHSSGLSGSSIIGGVSESTKIPISQSECKKNSRGAFRNHPGQPSNVDCMYNISLDTQHLHGLNNDHPLTGDILSYEKEDISVEKCKTSAPREKRFRKPTQRYIEEFSNSRSKEKVPTTATKNKNLGVSSCDELQIKIKALKKITGKKSSDGNSDVTLSELQVRRGRPKKEVLFSLLGILALSIFSSAYKDPFYATSPLPLGPRGREILQSYLYIVYLLSFGSL